MVVFKQNFDNIVLIVNDRLTVAGADGFQKLDELSFSVLDLAQVHDLFNDDLGNLDFE